MTIFLGILAYLVISFILYGIFTYAAKRHALNIELHNLILMGVIWPFTLIVFIYVAIGMLVHKWCH